MAVLLSTSLGELTVDLYGSRSKEGGRHFLNLAHSGFYDGTIFHRIERNFVVTGGLHQGAVVKEENPTLSELGKLDEKFDIKGTTFSGHKEKGVVGLVPVKGKFGAQFYISLTCKLDYLDDVCCVIGELGEHDKDFFDRVNRVPLDDEKRPLTVFSIKKAMVLDDPFDKIVGLREGMLRGWGNVAENLIVDSGKSELVWMEELAERQARSRAAALEILGDIPDAKMAPKRTVLFLCKLNPATRAEDLKTIFSR